MQTTMHSNPVRPRTISRRAGRRSQRRATVVLEFVVVLPILVIVLVGIVQFGVFYANMQQVTLASRVGAEEASQTAGLASAAAIPPNILLAVNQQLQTAGMSYCRVRLEHNVGGSQVELYFPSENACVGGPDEVFPGGGPPGEYVRLTVTVRLAEAMPDNIGCFGFGPSGANKTAFATTTFGYEL